MNSLFALRALLFAGECFAASAVLLSLVWLASKFLKEASLRHVVWHPIAPGIAHAEVVLAPSVTLEGGPVVPMRRQGRRLRDAFTILVP